MRKGTHATRKHRQAGSDGGRWLPLLLVVAALAAYANSFHGAFLLDDHRSIERNARLHRLWPVGPVLSGRRPVVDFTFAVNYALGGLNITGYHVVNLLIHALAGLTLFGIVRRTLDREPFRDRFGRASPHVALVAATIWTVHPLQTESVTYVIQRAESLMGLFYLLTLYCVIRGGEVHEPRESQRGGVAHDQRDSHRGRAATGGAVSYRWMRWYAAAVVCCALGMGSKAVMVTAPLVVLLYDRVFLSSSWRQVARRRWGLYAGLVATAAVLVVTKVALKVLSPRADLTGTVGFAYKDVTSLEYALTQAGVIWQYLLLSLWPVRLCLDHGWPIARTIGGWLPYVLVIGALVAGTGWALVRKPWMGFLGAWFFLILAPTSSIIPIKDPLFEHRMYLPLAAVVVLGVLVVRAGLQTMFGRLASGGGSRVPSTSTSTPKSPGPDSFFGGDVGMRRRRTFSAIVATAAIGVLIFGTVRRNRVYAGELRMWSDVVAKRPANPRARYNLGRALLDLGNYDAAASAFRAALHLDPTFVEAHYNLGNVLSRLGRVDEAEKSYREAIHLKPDMPQAHSDLGNILVRTGRIEEAIRQYREAIRVGPRYVRSYFNLGNVLLEQGKVEEAVETLRRAVKLDPKTARIHFLLGNALRQAGDTRAAQAEYRQTLALDPGYVPARRILDALRRH